MFLPQLLRRYATRHPSASLYCDEMNQADIVTGLREGDYELAFTYDLQVPEEVDFMPLYRFPPYAVVAADHPLGGRESIGLAELGRWPMALLDWPLSREYFLSIFTHHGLSPTVAHRAKSMNMVRGLVANGFGFSLFNTPVEALDAGDLNPLRIEQDAPPLSMGIACLRDLRLSPAAQAMHRLARDVDVQHEIFTPFGTGLTAEPDY